MYSCGSALNILAPLLAVRAQEQCCTDMMFLLCDLKYLENFCIIHCRCTSRVIQSAGFWSAPVAACYCKNHLVREFEGKLEHQNKRGCFQLSSLNRKPRKANKEYLCQNVGCLLELFYLIRQIR